MESISVVTFLIYLLGIITYNKVLSSHVQDTSPTPQLFDKACTRDITTTSKERETYTATCYRTVKKCAFLNIRCSYRQEGYSCSRTKYVMKTKVTKEKICCEGYLATPDGGEFCIRGCKEGTYGNTCSSTCACPDIADPECDIDTGDCFCPPGLTGRTCAEECPDGTYGEKCHENCVCKNNNYCDKVTGKCICTRPGWTGPLCDKECDGGWYGVDCKSSCSCFGKNNFVCDRITGDCSCVPGYLPPSCQEKCPSGYFGYLCKEQCACHNSTCNHVTGNCICSQPGYTGSSCDQECPDGSFGIGCGNTCSCSSHQTCDRKTGKCTCKQSGRVGYNCDQVCQEGKFGIGCNQYCACSAAQSCDAVDGTCRCTEPGVWGASCSLVCPEGKFGIDCSKNCACSVAHSCDAVDGTCRCKEPGVWGPSCSFVCPKSFYGFDCEKPCTCNEKKSCNPKTGECTCEPAINDCSGCTCYVNGTENCVKACLPCSYTPSDERCSLIPSLTVCKPEGNGTCVCKPGWTGKACDIVCPKGYFGPLCTEPCTCAENMLCDPVTGACLLKDTQSIQDTTKKDYLFVALLSSAGGAVLFTLCLLCIIVFAVRRRRSHKDMIEIHHTYKGDNEGFEDDYINYDSVIPVTNHLSSTDSKGEKSSVKLLKRNKRNSVIVANNLSPTMDIYAIVAKEIDKNRKHCGHDVTLNRTRKLHGKRIDGNDGGWELEDHNDSHMMNKYASDAVENDLNKGGNKFQ